MLDAQTIAPFGRELSDLIRSTAAAGAEPEVLVLAADPDSLAAAGGPTAVSPARIIDLLRRDELSLERLRTVVAFLPEDDGTQFSADLGFILSKSGGQPQLVILSDHEIATDLLERIPMRRWKSADLRHQLQLHEGRITMASSRRDQYIDNPEELRSKLKDLVRTIHDEEDPHEMTAYKKFVKQNVSVFSRAYLTAYLVKTLMAGGDLPRGRSQGGNGKPRKERRGGERPAADRRPAAAETTGNVAPEDRQTLFVSVGKNRRVYPKDFVALFAEVDGVEGDDIGQIKILDNYSFVEVDKTVADAIIDRYNGFEFRGRKLTVNFARSKKD